MGKEFKSYPSFLKKQNLKSCETKTQNDFT